MVDNLWTAAS